MFSAIWEDPEYGAISSLDDSKKTIIYGRFFYGGRGGLAVVETPVISNTADADVNEVDLVSADSKLIIQATSAFYHAIADVYAPVLKFCRDNSLIHIVIVAGIPDVKAEPHYRRMMKLLVKYLTSNGVKVTYLDDDIEKLVIRANNFVLIDRYEMTLTGANDVRKMFQSFHQRGVVVDKKIYLTRKSLGAGHSIAQKQIDNTPVGAIDFFNDLRVDDESLLEEYFRRYGFEVVNPDEDFKSIEEQVTFMSRVKVLISLTSAGLMNMLMMQDKQSIVELRVEFVSGRGMRLVQEIHDQYPSISFVNMHDYTLIPNKRSAQEIITEFESKPHLKAILES